MTGKYNTLLIRLRPETRALLDRASDEQRRSRASIIEQLISEALANRYNSTADRLNKLLAVR
jgi:predicted transcriptional regulator